MSDKNYAKKDIYSHLPSGIFLTAGQIATFAQVDVRTVRIWLRIRKLRGYRLGRGWYIEREDFVRFWESFRRTKEEWEWSE